MCIMILIFQSDPNINIYLHHPIKNVRGSCQFYETRKNISADVKNTTYDDAVTKYALFI